MDIENSQRVEIELWKGKFPGRVLIKSPAAARASLGGGCLAGLVLNESAKRLRISYTTTMPMPPRRHRRHRFRYQPQTPWAELSRAQRVMRVIGYIISFAILVAIIIAAVVLIGQRH